MEMIAGFGLLGYIVAIVIGIALFFAPLGIWSCAGKTVRQLEIQNLYLRILAQKADPGAKLPPLN